MDGVDGMDPDLLFTTDEEKTFQFDKDLPSLPVPSLQHTLDRYLDSVKPHVTDEEYRQTEFVVQQFASGVGKELQAELQKKAAASRNWLADWWLNYAYLHFRDPIATLLNFAGVYPYMHHYFPKEEGTQIYRAAISCFYYLRYWKFVREERLRADKDSKGTRFSMYQFHNAYSTCRIPGAQRDHINSYFKTAAEGPSPRNFTVTCRGRIFTLNAVDDNDEPLTPPELQQQLQYIRDKCDSLPPGPGVGALTGDNRNSWAKMRSRLVALSPKNYENLEEIQKSVLTVVLDDSCPDGEADLFYHALAGDPTNKWFDKSCSNIFYKNGLVASNCDHSPYDAMVLVSSTYYVDMSVRYCKGKWEGSTEIRKLDPPRELEFVLDEVLYKGIDNAKQVYNTFASDLVVSTVEFMDYGKSFLRKHKLHPDTHVQMALQYAYYKTYNRPAPTYQTGTTRKYYNGRTETVRSCTVEAIDWSKAMMDPALSKENQFHMYKIAADKHNRLMKEATDSHGCDRHLFGLQILALESGMQMPQLYTDPAYTKSGGGGNFVLSTSFVGYTTVYGGVAPMVEHGYGCFYRMQGTHINVFVSSWKSSGQTDARKFSQVIMECLKEMGEMIEKGTGQHAKL